MGKTATNISVVLGLITIAFGGFYLYTQYTNSVSEYDVSDQTMQTMLERTRVFIERDAILKKIALDIDIFDDARFRYLVSYSTPIVETTIGREDPFADVDTR
ncbi:hypothetical protein H6785_02380 [Candidatus Nomurabacteria bacterium]|nr:hypothetical protein [Candidatus Kaiserbacteria bacterium]MCB9815396.1 hypothetical protein [Candidatus Nomurabacteria bacterium]